MGLIKKAAAVAGVIATSGVVKAGINSVSGVLADQWKEFFQCESLSTEILVAKGEKTITGRSSNKKGNDNIISDGSGIAVADGQCMIIVENGQIVEFCAEPGLFTYDSSSEPSIFAGSLGEGIINTFKTIGKRFTYGGIAGKDQRVYYFNTKEIIGNRFGTPNPIPFRVVDSRIGFDMDVTLRCSGLYSYKIVDPLLFYTNVCGNITDVYRRSDIDEQLKAEFISALYPAVGGLSSLQIRPSDIPVHVKELCKNINEELSKEWAETRGIVVVNVSLNTVNIPKEDEELLKKQQNAAVLMNANMRQAALTAASVEAMTNASKNSGGASLGFMNMNMAQMMGANSLAAFNQQVQEPAPQAMAAPANSWKCSCGATATGKFCPECGAKKPEPVGAWKCSCGATVTGKFCPECGAKKPEDESGWVCSCGTVNKGKFCSNCGSKKPEGVPLYRCDKCGWEPEDPSNPPKFCPECGDVFDDNDIKK